MSKTIDWFLVFGFRVLIFSSSLTVGGSLFADGFVKKRNLKSSLVKNKLDYL